MFYTGTKFNIELEDLGDTYKLEGILIGDGQNTLAMLMPEADNDLAVSEYWQPTIEELEAWVKQSDDPVMKLYQDGDSKIVKAIIRKSTRQLDQSIVWKCYERDNYTCVYCGATGIPLTYDHYLAQAFGGQTTLENGRTSCRPCNKKKGHMTIDAWKIYAAEKGLKNGEVNS